MPLRVALLRQIKRNRGRQMMLGSGGSKLGSGGSKLENFGAFLINVMSLEGFRLFISLKFFDLMSYQSM